MKLSEGVPSNKGEKEEHPKRRYFTVLACIASKWLQIRPDMLLIITSTGDKLLRGINIDNLQ